MAKMPHFEVFVASELDVGISVVSLGAVIWTLAWRGGTTGYSVPFWQGWC